MASPLAWPPLDSNKIAVVNARDAMPGGDELWIEVDDVSLDETAVRRHPAARPGAFICLSLRDSLQAIGGNGSVFVVEDEPAMRALAIKILGAKGYRVLEASSGAAALELCRQQAGKFDLLLTDLIMPGGVSGAQLAAQLRTEQPGLRVIYMCGYRGDMAGGGVGVNFLQKPFDPAHLARMVRACLDTG